MLLLLLLLLLIVMLLWRVGLQRNMVVLEGRLMPVLLVVGTTALLRAGLLAFLPSTTQVFIAASVLVVCHHR